MAVVLISGGFDPLHAGHLNMIEAAWAYGSVTVALNSDAWLIRKKGYAFMPYTERSRIIRAIRQVRDVYAVDDTDGTVCEAIRRLKPDFFGNGGDRGLYNTPEVQLCMDMGVKLLFDLGGGKSQSSSDLVKAAMEAMHDKGRTSQPGPR